MLATPRDLARFATKQVQGADTLVAVLRRQLIAQSNSDQPEIAELKPNSKNTTKNWPPPAANAKPDTGRAR